MRQLNPSSSPLTIQNRFSAYLLARLSEIGIDLDAKDVGDARGIEKILARRAVLVIVVVFPVLHEDRDHFVPGALEQPRRHRRIDAA